MVLGPLVDGHLVDGRLAERMSLWDVTENQRSSVWTHAKNHAHTIKIL